MWARHKINAKMFETQAKPTIWLDGVSSLQAAGYSAMTRRDARTQGADAGRIPALCTETGEIMGFTPLPHAGGQDDR